MTCSSHFWDVLAPHHAAVENNYLDLASLRRIVALVIEPVLVVGAGQGLIVAELRKKGFQCDGVDLSSEMIRYAKLRRGLSLIEADASAMPFGKGTYRTIIYATGVLDFIGDDEQIRVILNEGRRVVNPAGKIFIAFYRLSRALEGFVIRVGLLRDNVLCQRRSLELYLLNPVQTVAWVANQTGGSYLHAVTQLLRLSALSTMQETAMTFRMQRICRNMDNPRALIDAAPETQPYRNEAAIRSLFERLAVPIKQVQASSSCHIVEI